MLAAPKASASWNDSSLRPHVIAPGPLRQLLAPVSLDEFVERYWERRALFIPGAADKLAGLFDLDSFYRAVGEARPGLGRRRPYVKAGYRDADGEHREVDVQPSQIPALLDAGMTIQAEGLEAIDPRLHALCIDTRRELGVPGDVDVACFVSPHDSGYGLHFDATTMWILQIEGEKVWRYSPAPALEFPTHNYVPRATERDARIHGLDESAHVEQVLRPGDVLYLPPGIWHRVRARGHSVHLSLTIRPTDFLAFATGVLAPRVLADPLWRRLPSLPATSQARTDDGIAASLGARLTELRAAVNALTESELAAAWRARVERDGPARALGPKAPAPEQVLVRARPLRFSLGQGDDGGSVLLLHGSTVLGSLPADVIDFVRALAGAERFVAREATRWGGEHDWDDVAELLAELVQLGVLRPE